MSFFRGSMIEQQFLVVALYLIKTILVLKELIQDSSLGGKILLFVSPWVQDAPAAAPWCLPHPSWTCRMSPGVC